MSMELTGLDIVLRRMESIERQFQTLSQTTAQTADSTDFQNILNQKMGSQNTSNDPEAIVEKYFPNMNNPLRNFSSEETESSNIDGDIDSLINKYSQKNNLDSDFVKAVIKQESGFQPTAKSHCGAMGLMQLMPGTADSLGVKDAFDPEQNIAGGTKYLSNLLNQYNGNKELALAAYNAGSGAVKKYGGVPPYSETQNYVKNILSTYGNYKAGGSI